MLLRDCPDSHNYIIALPDLILESAGYACGDQYLLAVRLTPNSVYFVFESDACQTGTCAAAYLMRRLSGKSRDAIAQFIAAMLVDDNALLQLEIGDVLRHLACIRMPFVLLQAALQHEQYVVEGKSFEQLACDACVSTFPTQWQQTESPEERPQLPTTSQVAGEVGMEITLQRYGKALLSDQEHVAFTQFMQAPHRLEQQYKQIKQLKLPILYCNNLRTHQIPYDLLNRVVVLAKRQAIAKIFTQRLADAIQSAIEQHAWQIIPVKGQVTQRYYPQMCDRTFLDYDYLCGSFHDAFQFVDYLINHFDFHFVSDGSVPFSLKVVTTHGEEALTGHLHLERILHDTYQMIVDINIGGFPNGRVGALKYDSENGHVEQQILITLLHAMKHELVYMKDINDLYYMIQSRQANPALLQTLVRRERLEIPFSCLLKLLERDYQFQNAAEYACGTLLSWVARVCVAPGWPYDREAHRKLKQFDLFITCLRLYGLRAGIREYRSQLTEMPRPTVPSRKYIAIFSMQNFRKYLKPVIIFKIPQEIDTLSGDDRFAVVSDAEMIYGFGLPVPLFVTPIGLFLDAKRGEYLNAAQLDEAVSMIFTALQVGSDIVMYRYMAQARRDLWLY